jgi:hypothetical protein
MRIAFGGGLTVSAEERWFTEIRAGRAFHGGAISGAQAGNITKFQLLNPAASGITVIVYKMGLHQGTTGRISLAEHGTALTTNVTAYNLLQGGNAPSATFNYVRDANAYGTVRSYHNSLADVWHWFHAPWSYELGEGEGVHLFHSTVNDPAAAEFLWIEV